MFGSSSQLINGPTSAISLVVFSALSMFDPDQRVEAAEAVFLLGVMVGSIQVVVAALRLGDLTRYISDSVIRVGNAPGVRDEGTGVQHVLHRLWLTLTKGDPVNLKAVIVSAAALGLALLLRRAVRCYRLPQFDMLAVLVVVSAGAYFAGWTEPVGIVGGQPSAPSAPCRAACLPRISRG